MALLTSTAHAIQQREVMKTLETKLWLESRMAFDLRSLFKKMSTATAEYYSHHGTVLNLNSFDIDMTACLRKWYRKTADIFSKNIRQDIKSDSELFELKGDNLDNTNTDKKKINAEIAAALLLFIEQQSKKQTDLIMDTSKNIIRESIGRIRTEIEAAGETIDKRTIAEAVRKEFNERSIARSELTSKQEVGMMASESKKTEASILNSNESAALITGVGIIALSDKIMKNWNAILDMVTRPEPCCGGLSI